MMKNSPGPIYSGLGDFEKKLDILVAKRFLELIPIGKDATLSDLGLIHLAEIGLNRPADTCSCHSCH